MLLQDNGGGGCPPLPSLTKLDLIDVALSARRTLRLCDAFMNRMEQGVPLEALDLSTCYATSRAVRLLSEIVVDVWGPAEGFGTEELIHFTWDSAMYSAARGPFVPDDNSNTSDDYEERDEEEIDEEIDDEEVEDYPWMEED